jgi:serine O-acetyltransferase
VTTDFERELRARHPKLREAILADARVSSGFRGRPLDGLSDRSILIEAAKLAWRSDAFLAQAVYRAKARLQAIGVPVLPRILHRLAMAIAQVSIGDPVVIAPGLYLPHGQVVIDGIVEIGPRTRILPWTTIGLLAGNMQGPTIEGDVAIGTGAKVLGPVKIGRGAKVGANAAVLSDVPAGATAVGVPARIIERGGS